MISPMRHLADDLYLSGGAFVDQHFQDTRRLFVAEELAEFFLVIADFVFLDESDEIRRGVA